MSKLFRRLQPRQKFRITITCIALLLKIPKHKILRIECWAYIIFVHRQDEGGQFISYRKLQHWQNAAASQIQNCSTFQQMQSLWLAIAEDAKNTKSITTKSICRFYTKSGQNAGIFFGTRQSHHPYIGRGDLCVAPTLNLRHPYP